MRRSLPASMRQSVSAYDEVPDSKDHFRNSFPPDRPAASPAKASPLWAAPPGRLSAEEDRSHHEHESERPRPAGLLGVIPKLWQIGSTPRCEKPARGGGGRAMGKRGAQTERANNTHMLWRLEQNGDKRYEVRPPHLPPHSSSSSPFPPPHPHPPCRLAFLSLMFGSRGHHSPAP